MNATTAPRSFLAAPTQISRAEEARRADISIMEPARKDPAATDSPFRRLPTPTFASVRKTPGRALAPGSAGSSGKAESDRATQAAILLANAFPARPARRRRTALLLCLFMGWAGSHRYYVGRRSTGLLYLATGGLFLFGVLVDLICILAGCFYDSAGRPLE